MTEQEIWSEILAAYEALAVAQERLRKALTRMDVVRDQKSHDPH